MAGGYWEKGQNPYWNYDSDAALNDKRRIDAQLDASRAQHEVKMLKEREQVEQAQTTSALNAAANVQANLSKKIQDGKEAFYKLAMKSNIFQAALEELIIKNPEMADEILDAIQASRDKCNAQDYRHKWWEWVSTSELTPQMNYLKFPFEQRENKKS